VDVDQSALAFVGSTNDGFIYDEATHLDSLAGAVYQCGPEGQPSILDAINWAQFMQQDIAARAQPDGNCAGFACFF
jgi:hypothetical protein